LAPVAAAKNRTRMTAVVKPQVGPAGEIAGTIPVPVERRGLQMPAVVSRKDQGITTRANMFSQVRLDGRDDVRRNVDVTYPGVTLGRGDRERAFRPYGCAADADHVGAQIYVAAAQFDDLPESQRTPGRQRDHEPQPLGHRLGEHGEFLDAG